MQEQRSLFSLVCALGIAQTLAWASSYYLPAVLATAMARDLQTTPTMVFAAFSLALVVSAALGPFAGRLIDRLGGRPVLITSNLIFAVGLVAMALSVSVTQLFIAWAVMGVGMASGLYESAFATVVRLRDKDARSAITGITLFAGFASTIGWPLTAALVSRFDWQTACMAWAALHLVVALPLNLSLPHANPLPTRDATVSVSDPDHPLSATDNAAGRRTAFLLAYIFAVTWFISTAMAAHLPGLLQGVGVSFVAAVAIAALVGPAQVAGRIVEFSVLQRFHPLLSARLAALAHPLGAAAIGIFGVSAATGFAVLHGAGNGILTIAIGTLPLLLFGPQGYGRRQGLLMVPARLVQAGAPFLFGIALARWGSGALWISGVLGLTAVGALMLLRAPDPHPPTPDEPTSP